MVIFEGSISHKVFKNRLSDEVEKSHDDIVLGLAKICAGAMFVYFFLKVLVFIHEHNWAYLNTAWGYWFLVEIIGFVLIPFRLYTHAVKYKNVAVVKLAPFLTLVGILVKPFKYFRNCIITGKWQRDIYPPGWKFG